MQANARGEIEYDRFTPTRSLRKNIKAFKAFFKDDETVKYTLCAQDSCCLIFIDGMVESSAINHFLLEPLQVHAEEGLNASEQLAKLAISDAELTQKYSEAVNALTRGDTVFLQDGSSDIHIFSTKGFPMRSISEPDNEKALFGPREGFTESLMQNTAMLRRKLATSDLKIKFQTVSRRTYSRACICYLESLVNRGVLEELQRRLDKLDVDSFLDTYAINEHIRDNKHSLFITIGKTERPDTTASKLLDGGVALILDGTPVVLILPYLFVENFKSQDDMYVGFYYASACRILRYLAFLITISVGALYISLVTFHTEMIPTSFVLTIAAATSGLPIPTFLEFIIMMTMFEMLRESGIRMSSKFGQSLSIVGALVIGQAAVEARLISAPMVIIVAVSAITGLMIPSLSSVVIIMRMAAVIASSLFGFYGFGFVMLALLTHLSSLESFGLQFTADMLSFRKEEMLNAYLRPPSPAIRYRTRFLARDRRRSR